MAGLMTKESRLFAGDLFSGLKPESVNEKDKVFQINDDPFVKDIINAYRRIIHEFDEKIYRDFCYEKNLERYLDTNKLKYSNIYQFSRIDIDSVFPDKSMFHQVNHGRFLSILVNNSIGNVFQLDTMSQKIPPNEIGYQNNGKIINIRGNVLSYLGMYMKDGQINLEGDSFENVGYRMNGGEIHLNGNYYSISNEITGGDIYHRGKRIIKNGKPVEGASIIWHLF